uniref:hypothetical protein n=1 Tax=Pseudomonas viridiflava TaxID=33069 RepID=UPI0019804B09
MTMWPMNQKSNGIPITIGYKPTSSSIVTCCHEIEDSEIAKMCVKIISGNIIKKAHFPKWSRNSQNWDVNGSFANLKYS